MDYYGLFQKYKLNRPLGDEERKLQLNQKDRLDVDPVYFCSTIELNDTYIEVVDKFYAAKGLAGSVALVLIPLACALLLLSGYLFLALGLLSDRYDRNIGIFGGIVLAILDCLLLVLLVRGLLKEAFCYTHYPIRLNRKSRMLHVFRFDGTVLSVPWDALFFTLGRGNQFFGVQTWDVRAHVLDVDGKTVRDTFSLAMASESQRIVRLYWEYVRRYMEEGPQAVLSLTPVYLPISKHRETWRFGLMRLALDGPWIVVLVTMLPFHFLVSLGRWFAMRTSKIPVWPKEVEDVCCIEPNDPYARDARDNPPELWKVLWANRKTQYLERSGDLNFAALMRAKSTPKTYRPSNENALKFSDNYS
jgi:hypothetical protein